jgi:hypothetical protein
MELTANKGQKGEGATGFVGWNLASGDTLRLVGETTEFLGMGRRGSLGRLANQAKLEGDAHDIIQGLSHFALCHPMDQDVIHMNPETTDGCAVV